MKLKILKLSSLLFSKTNDLISFIFFSGPPIIVVEKFISFPIFINSFVEFRTPLSTPYVSKNPTYPTLNWSSDLILGLNWVKEM